LQQERAAQIRKKQAELTARKEKERQEKKTARRGLFRRSQPSDYSDESEYEDESEEEEIKEVKRRWRVPKNVWIVKPGENTNRGNGITVCGSLPEIKRVIQMAHSNPQTRDRTFILQKYIDHPLLIGGRKFDFRCYGMLTSLNGHLKGYFYDDGYVRTSCELYDIDDLTNKFIHLTNDAVQKKAEDYGKFENGNKMSLQDFQKYLTQSYPSLNVDVQQHLIPQIRKLVTDTFRAVGDKIDPARLHNSFEILGYDFMLDEDFKLYLIEVNTNPCLEMSCPLLARIIPELLDNAFRVVLDPLFPSPDLSNNKKCAINEIPQVYKFELVYDDKLEGDELKALLRGKMNVIKEEIESDEESLLDEETNED